MTTPRTLLHPMIYAMVLLGLILALTPGTQESALASTTPDSSASAAPADKRMCKQTPEITCTLAAHVKRFKAGKFGRVHGIHVRMFASAAAKDAMMLKVARKMPLKPLAAEKKATCAKAPKWACSHSKHATRGGTREGHKRCMQSDLCRAYNRYGALASGATCIGADASYYHPSCIPYKLQHPGWHGFTKHQIQVGGTAALCGAMVAVTIAGGGGPVTAAAGVATLNCLWQLWRDVDPS